MKCGAWRHHRGGFTLIEVLATLMLMAIVLPAVMEGITMATGAADMARRRTEAAGLAQAELQNLVVTGQWQSGILTGEFGPNGSRYNWQASTRPWPLDNTDVNMQQLDLTVTWMARGRSQSLTISTLVYVRNAEQA